jgi:hypothetical protein
MNDEYVSLMRAAIDHYLNFLQDHDPGSDKIQKYELMIKALDNLPELIRSFIGNTNDR